MLTMTKLLTWATTIALFGAPLIAAPAADPAPQRVPRPMDSAERVAGFKPLFNGQDLTGWKHHGKSGTFVVSDGVLVGERTSRDLAYYIETDREYGDYELRLQYKIVKDGNSGVFIRIPAEGWPSHAGMEIQLLDDAAKRGQTPTVKDTGSIYRLVAPKSFSSRPAGEWNDLWVLCDGDRVKITLNGDLLLDTSMADHEKLKDRPRKGFIGLSAHSGPVRFRHLRLRELTRSAPSTRPSATKPSR